MALTRLFSREAGDDLTVSVQNPLRLSERSEPEPDVVLLRPRADRYRSAPAIGDDAALVIEVSDSSLAYDTEVKLPLYARHGIIELWIVDITTGEIQVCREPADGGYAQVKRYGAGQFVSPLSLASAKFAVDDVLGPPA